MVVRRVEEDQQKDETAQQKEEVEPNDYLLISSVQIFRQGRVFACEFLYVPHASFGEEEDGDPQRIKQHGSVEHDAEDSVSFVARL